MIKREDIAATILACQDESHPNSTVHYEHSEKKNVFLRFLLDIKVQIDRWDLVTTIFIFNQLVEDFVMQSLHDHVTKDANKVSLWGARILFTDAIPVDKVLAMASGSSDNKHIALGQLDLSAIERLQNLKAFW